MKIFDIMAHEGYHYELCKLGCEFTILQDRVNGKVWDQRYRPVPKNVSFIDRSSLSIHYVEQHDVAIIHNYKQYMLLRECNMPKILIMHCTKHGQGDAELCAVDLSNYYVIFNSYKDQERWNLSIPRQRVIWHGFDPNEWPVSDRTVNRIFTVGRRISERDNVCGYRIVKEFDRSGMAVKIVGDNPTISIEAPSDFEEFRKCHGKYAVYLNPTIKSPMPRGRGEAMMSGIPIVTTDFFDEELFIENGVNGFRTNNVQQLKEYAALLLADERLQAEIAKSARSTAVEKFHVHRFLTEWQDVLTEVTSKKVEVLVDKPQSMRIYVTRKDSSAGGGTVTSSNVLQGLRNDGYNVRCLDINSKGWVSFVDGKKMPTTSAREWINFIKDNPCDLIIFDDIERYQACKKNVIEHKAKWDCDSRVFLCILGNPQVHESCWCESGILNFDEVDNEIEKILCRPIYARFLRGLFGEDKVMSWIGGCNGDEMRRVYNRAFYKHPNDGALVISAHRGTDWWKNPSTAVLAAYGLYRRYPGLIYFKPSMSDSEKRLLKHVTFDIQYGGKAKEGMDRERLLQIMAYAQLAIEPAYSEGFSRSCNEMMNLGVPVIQGPNAEHLWENKLLCKYMTVKDASDIQGIVDKAEALLTDEGLWNEVSAECIRFSARYNVEQEVETLVRAVRGIG